MSDPVPLPYGRDRAGRFTPGNTAGKGRAHPFARQAAALRRAFFEAVTEEDMQILVRKLIEDATGGNLQAARLVLLWILGKPHEPLHPDAIQTAVEAMEAAEGRTEPEHFCSDAERQSRERLAVRLLAQEIRATRGLHADPVAAGEDLDHPC
jgi:hypothetical protein